MVLSQWRKHRLKSAAPDMCFSGLVLYQIQVVSLQIDYESAGQISPFIDVYWLVWTWRWNNWLKLPLHSRVFGGIPLSMFSTFPPTPLKKILTDGHLLQLMDFIWFHSRDFIIEGYPSIQMKSVQWMKSINSVEIGQMIGQIQFFFIIDCNWRSKFIEDVSMKNCDCP